MPDHDIRPRWQVLRRRLMARPDTERLFLRCFAGSDWCFWLDSSAASADQGERRVSILGDACGPHAERLSYRQAAAEWTVSRASGETVVSKRFFEHLGGRLAEQAVSDETGLGFNLGFVGALGYELGQECGAGGGHCSPHPDAALIFADRAIVVDHGAGAVELLALTDGTDDDRLAAQQWCARMAARIAEVDGASALSAPAAAGQGLRFRLARTRTQYLAEVAACQDYIARGEAYEICLTTRATAGPLPDPLRAYRALRRTSPAPFGAYLRLGKVSVLSASPERFLQIDSEALVRAQPIKGTRRRGTDPLEDARIRAELAGSSKDRAENLMIVDLLRNDLNRVCTTDSVRAAEICAIHSFSHVHQLVSTIEGRLRPEVGALEGVAAAYPGGSMTGAPKLRAMEIIAALESGARGLYSGALGWFALGGAVDLAMTIRTVVADAATTSFGIGGAVVADSDPEEEFAEILVKAQALLDGLGAELDCD